MYSHVLKCTKSKQHLQLMSEINHEEGKAHLFTIQVKYTYLTFKSKSSAKNLLLINVN